MADLTFRFEAPPPTWPRELAIGPSTLIFLAMGYVEPHSSLRLAVPDSLRRLLDLAADESGEHVRFLVDLVTEGHEGITIPGGAELARMLRGFFQRLERQDQLITIMPNDVDAQVAEALNDSFGGERYEVSLSPKRNFLRDYFIKIISWSKRTGNHIIESTREKFVALGDYIVSLQIPQKAEAVIQWKEQFVRKAFGFRGGKPIKWFIGVTIATMGMGSPIASAVGVGIAFIDP